MQKIVVFDFDKTITIVDSGLLFCVYKLTNPIQLFKYLKGDVDLPTSLRRKKRYVNVPKWLTKLNLNRRILIHLRYLKSKNCHVVLLTGSSINTISEYSRVMDENLFDDIVCLDDLVKLSIKSLAEAKKTALLKYNDIYYFINDNLDEVNMVRPYVKHVKLV